MEYLPPSSKSGVEARDAVSNITSSTLLVVLSGTSITIHKEKLLGRDFCCTLIIPDSNFVNRLEPLSSFFTGQESGREFF